MLSRTDLAGGPSAATEHIKSAILSVPHELIIGPLVLPSVRWAFWPARSAELIHLSWSGPEGPSRQTSWTRAAPPAQTAPTGQRRLGEVLFSPLVTECHLHPRDGGERPQLLKHAKLALISL